MSLINCPSCQKKISDKSQVCPHCGLDLNMSAEDMERLKILKNRNFKDKMYRFKMLTLVAVAIALIGVVPMVWNYARAIDYGFNAVIINHWGIYFAVAGFLLYVFLRVSMVIVKRRFLQEDKIDK